MLMPVFLRLLPVSSTFNLRSLRHGPCSGRIDPSRLALAVGALLALTLAAPPARAQSVVATLSLPDSTPYAIAVNPVTNQVYVANRAGASVSVIDGATDTKVATPTVGSEPYAIAVNPVTNRTYVANYGGNSVSVINGATNTVVATPTVGTNPDAIAVNPVTNMVYVANNGGKSVSVIDGATNTVVATLTVGTNPYAIAINPVTNQVYVANEGSASVSVIDGATNAVVATPAVGTNPVSIAVNPVTNLVYVANSGAAGYGNTVSVIDGATNAVVATPTVGSGPHAIAVNPVTNQVYVANWNSNTVSVIDGATNTVVATPAVGVNPIAIAVNPVTNQVFIANNDSDGEFDGNSVSVIDGATNTVVTTLELGDLNGIYGNVPQAIAVNPVTNMVYTANFQGHRPTTGSSVSVIDGAVNSTVATPAVGSNPGSDGAIAMNQVTNMVYVTNWGSASVSVIDEATNTVVATPGVGSGPGAIAVNPVTNTVYVANGDSASVSVIDGATNAVVATPAVGSDPSGITVNPVTNMIYVANAASASVSVIDGVTNAVVATLAVGTNPGIEGGIAVNPVTNMVYVANEASDNISVIDGATNAVVATLTGGIHPISFAVNPVTNMVYVANGSDSVSVIDGATNTVVATPTVGTNPYAIAVNPATNMVYVGNEDSDNVSVIDGATNTVVATPYVGYLNYAIAVNPLTNQVYVAIGSANIVSVIDGATNTVVATPGVGSYPGGLAVNPVTNQIYVTNYYGNSVSVIAANPVAQIPLNGVPAIVSDSLTVSTSPPFVTRNTAPAFTVTVTSNYTGSSVYFNDSAAANPPPTAVYYWVDDGSAVAGAPEQWAIATDTSAPGANPAVFTLQLSGQSQGLHTLYYYAAYGNGGTAASSNNGAGNSPETGNIEQIVYVVQPITALISPAPGSALPGPTVTFTWAAAPGATGYSLWLGSTSGASDLYNSGEITATSATATNLPTNGETIYAELIIDIGTVQYKNNYTFTAGTLAALTSPTAGSVFTRSTVTFTWTTSAGAAGYNFNLGSTPGASDLYASGEITATSATASGLPTNGETIYATLYTDFGSIVLSPAYSNAYTFTAVTLAALVSPTPGLGTVLGVNDVTFTWTAGTGVTLYDLWVGTTGVGSDNVYVSGHTTSTSATAPHVPANAAEIYVRLWCEIDRTWQSIDYTYSSTQSAAPALTTPTPGLGTVLGVSNVTFTWTSGAGVTAYQLDVGTGGVDSSNAYVSGHITTTSTTAPHIPANAAEVYVRLWYEINGIWQSIDYTYSSTQSAAPALTTPTPGLGTVLGISNITFTWTSGAGVTAFQLNVGTGGVGSSNVYSSGHITTTSSTVPSVYGVATDTVYVRLWYEINGAWQSIDYTYSGTPSVAPVLTTPTPGLGTVLGTTNVSFTWTRGSGVTAYLLWLGTTGVGSHNVYNSGRIMTTSITVPSVYGVATDTIYVRLLYEINETWQSTDYVYSAIQSVAPGLTTPTPGLGTVLGLSNVTFTWTAGTGVTAYQLSVGTTGVGSDNVYVSGRITATSATAPKVPYGVATNTVYVRLWYLIDKTWQLIDYTYSATPSVAPALTTPTPGLGTVLGTSNVTFTWTTGTGVTAYQLSVGTTGVGSDNVHVSGHITTTSATAPKVPYGVATDTVYVRLWYLINETWQSIDYTYSATQSVAPSLTTPAPGLGTQLGTSNVTFTWTSGTGVTAYELSVGTNMVGSVNVYVSGQITATSATVPKVPYGEVTDTVYVRLYYEINEIWKSIDYTYSATPSVAPSLTTPTPNVGTVLGTSNVTFTWTPGNGVTAYDLNVGSSATGLNSGNIYDSGHITTTSTTVPNVPAIGATIYARLWYLIDGTWQSTDYTYSATQPVSVPAMISPSPGNVLGTSNVTFTWTPGNGVTAYDLDVGTNGVGSGNLYVSGPITTTSATAPTLPARGRTVYVRLWHESGRVWQSIDYTYTEQQ